MLSAERHPKCARPGQVAHEIDELVALLDTYESATLGA
jgi:hypothetical protein